jgi:SAM-dependent methyltransferase
VPLRRPNDDCQSNRDPACGSLGLDLWHNSGSRDRQDRRREIEVPSMTERERSSSERLPDRPPLAGVRLRCPGCRAAAPVRDADRFRCTECGRAYPIIDGRVHFLEPDGAPPPDPLDRIKRPFKRRRRIADREGAFVNLGSGNTRIHERVVNLDATPYDEVDLVCDIADLPLEDASVDVVFNISVLEHLPDPETVLAEIRRVLRPGGWIYTDVPFIVGYHASPGDYHRWTDDGVRALHRGFETDRIVINGGPSSALLWVFQEWAALAFSFGSRRLHTALYLMLMVLTFPFKFFDVLLRHHPLARHVSSCFIYTGRKREEEGS